MAIVVEKDVAQGSGAKSFDNVEIYSYGDEVCLEENGDGDSELVKDNDKQSTLSAPLESRKSQKRTCENDFKLQNISSQMEDVAMTLQKRSKSKLDEDFFIKIVMKIERFEKEFLGNTFDHLVEWKNLVNGFLEKCDKLRRIWFQKFKENN